MENSEKRQERYPIYLSRTVLMATRRMVRKGTAWTGAHADRAIIPEWDLCIQLTGRLL